MKLASAAKSLMDCWKDSLKAAWFQASGRLLQYW